MPSSKKGLKIYNSLSGKKETFIPIRDKKVGLYVCGPTVYSYVHLGNCRTFISFDLIYRYLLHLGFKVRYVRNITDVGHLENDDDSGDDSDSGNDTGGGTGGGTDGSGCDGGGGGLASGVTSGSQP